MAIYLGGVVAGIACAVHVLRASFSPAPGDTETTVTFWRYFRGSLGAWMCIWGAIAMLTSAPFDDWWHNAYGLDVKILSPPHALLALGILMIQMGAMFMILALQNRQGEAPAYRRMYALAAGLVLVNFATISSEYSWRIFQHGTLFWQVVAGIAPLAPLAPLAPAAVLALVDGLAGEHRLDTARIGLLGHSMGGGVAARVAAAAPERLRGAGAAVEYHPHPHEGHTLLVGEALPGALAWLAALLRR